MAKTTANLPAETATRPALLPEGEVRRFAKTYVDAAGQAADALLQIVEHEGWRSLNVTWEVFWRETLGEVQVLVHKNERDEYIRRLRQAGLTFERIGQVVGVSAATAHRALEGHEQPPQIESSTGARRRSSSAGSGRKPKPKPADDIVDAEIVDEPAPTPESPEADAPRGKVWLPAAAVSANGLRRLEQVARRRRCSVPDLIVDIIRDYVDREDARDRRADRDRQGIRSHKLTG